MIKERGRRIGRREALAKLAGAAVAVRSLAPAKGAPATQGTAPREASPTSSDEWPQFRGEPRLRGVAPRAPAALSVAWTHEAGEVIESSAAIVGGVVYVGAQPGKLLALDLRTGARLWAYESVGDIGFPIVLQ